MKDLTKKELEQLISDSNESLLSEYFATYADEQVTARKENLQRYSSFVEGAKNYLDQIIEKAKSDYENNIIGDEDIDYLIDDQCQRARDAVEYVVSSLMALKSAGIKPSEKGPVYPVSKYTE